MRGTGYYSQHEASSFRDNYQRASRTSKLYKDKYLSLRRELRDFFRREGIELPQDIKSLIGMK